jgi:HAMP domain-containing protein
MTLAELQSDPYFKELANQAVGVTGYTFIVDTKSTARLVHPNAKMLGVTLITSAQVDKQPGYQELVDSLLAGKETFGYYTFKDPNTGAQRPKYMYIAKVNQSTADGVVMGVCSSTFIDEFSQPVKQIGEKLNASTAKTVSDIRTSTESMGSGNTILMITLVSMIVVIAVSFVFASGISRPIRRLTEVANAVNMGKLDEQIDIHTNDEINDLADSFRRMINAFKIMVSMQEANEEEQA